MAWQRAKGELLSIQCASFSPDNCTPAQYDEHQTRAKKIHDCIKDFIREMEMNGWDE
jgi:hypothetical protein